MRLCPGVLPPLLLLASPALAQAPPADPSSASTFTLQTGTRLVLTDLIVSDRDGNPVHGLPATAFHITEDKKPQDLASFEEHRSEEHPPATTQETSLHAPKSALPGTYSNDFLLHPPPVLNILVLDTTNIALEDQMFLSFQLTRFLQAFPPGASLAIYGRSGPRSVLLQNFTTDRNLLLAAINHAIPRLPPSGREYLTDLATLQQISDSFGDLPGRKKTSSGSPAAPPSFFVRTPRRFATTIAGAASTISSKPRASPSSPSMPAVSPPPPAPAC